MINLFTSFFAFLLTIGFIVFFIYFGVIFIALAFAAFVFLWMLVMLRFWWLRLRYGSKNIVIQEETHTPTTHKTTIIDVEYQDISEKK